MFQKGMILASYFVSLICGSLICTSLMTNSWLESNPYQKRNPLNSSGRIHFGLLWGQKELTHDFGWVKSDCIFVPDMIKDNPHMLSWNLWVGTLVSTSLALFFTGIAAFLAVVNTVTTPGATIFAVPGIYLTNILSFLLCLTAACLWAVQFHTKLRNSVIGKDEESWTSEGASQLGYSFWFVVAASVLHIINVVLVRWSRVRTKIRQLKPFCPMEEKAAGAIMLY